MLLIQIFDFASAILFWSVPLLSVVLFAVHLAIQHSVRAGFEKLGGLELNPEDATPFFRVYIRNTRFWNIVQYFAYSFGGIILAYWLVAISSSLLFCFVSIPFILGMGVKKDLNSSVVAEGNQEFAPRDEEPQY